MDNTQTNLMTWTIKWETLSGTIQRTEIQAATDTLAIVLLCRRYTVGNVLAVSDCYGVQWV
jgi:hypothetical protein